MSWALVTFIYIASGGGTAGGPAMTTVPGFTTEEACRTAARQMREGLERFAQRENLVIGCIQVR